MLIKIGAFDISECWDGVFYKKLSEYPQITDWEIQTVSDFIRYEEDNGRSCEIEAEDSVLQKIAAYKNDSAQRIEPPAIIKECTACPNYKGCMTDLICHTSPIENAIKILDCGCLLSPVLSRGLSTQELKAESRNAANDPEDYFNYIMFAWGNCQAGDRLVMERKLGRFPNENDLSKGFTPGVRFFFRFDKLAHHPDATFDGVLPLKVKNRVILQDWIWAIIVPMDYKSVLEKHVPKELEPSVYYLQNDCKDIWEWSEKVYEYAKSLKESTA
ncbi:MAG: hypothetical protein J6D38_06485 [Solobacterium sp.]|nr:hypothetical protein [Solobacterium sp.]